LETGGIALAAPAAAQGADLPALALTGLS